MFTSLLGKYTITLLCNILNFMRTFRILTSISCLCGLTPIHETPVTKNGKRISINVLCFFCSCFIFFLFIYSDKSSFFEMSDVYLLIIRLYDHFIYIKIDVNFIVFSLCISSRISGLTLSCATSICVSLNISYS